MRKKVIKIATFNLFNMVLPEIEYYGNRKYSIVEFEKKVDWIAYKLNEINADIVAFQEIFHKEAIQKAIDKSGIYRNAEFIVANPCGTLPRVGLLSRFPINKHFIYEDYPQDSIIEILDEENGNIFNLPFKKFSRPVLRADISIFPNLTFSCYVVHLKSKRPILLENEDKDNPVHSAKAATRSLIVRAAEATAIRSILMETLHNKDKPVIVFGDLNDSGLSVTTQLLTGQPPHRKFPQDVKRKLWDVLLYQVKDIQARRSYNDVYYTYIHNGHYESLDHIMVSQEIVTEYPNHVAKIGYVSLYNDHLIDNTLTDEKEKPWKSDHGIVAATIEILLDKIENINNSELK